MKKPAQVSERIPFLLAVCFGACLGTGLGAALAQDRPPGQLDTACLSGCAAQGFDARYCDQVCWVPDPDTAAKGVAIDWICMTDCRERGGKHKDCRLRCERK